ncbi:hypothetical protein [Synechococcus sp. GEYO]|uniref:hypothetical protein n=1 Tax=Synechococcus sp. GEYO TaxID=2575511 RepID=UPI0010BD94C0|nr:hypothetical protein [Synechococcus sp. GEYO]
MKTTSLQRQLKNSLMAYKLIGTEFPDQNQTFIDSLESALWAVQKIKGSSGTIEDLIKEIEKAKEAISS